MDWVKISSKAELDAALAKGSGWLDLAASLRVTVTAGSWRIRAQMGFRATVVAWGNSSVEAWGNSSVEARGNSSVVAWGNSSVVAWENSSVVAWGNVFVRLFSALKLKASAHVAVMLHGKAKTLEGGRHLEAAVPDTAEKWCEHYGVEVKDGNAMLFKAVDDDWSTDRARRVGITYAPGQLPVAADWDGGKVECGAGLHASPHPRMAQVFNRTAKKFVCCPVAFSEIAVHPNGSYPEKVKFRGCAAPTFAVDVKGKPVEVPA